MVGRFRKLRLKGLGLAVSGRKRKLAAFVGGG